MIACSQNSNVFKVMEFDDESTVLQVFGESGVEGCCDHFLKERCIQRRFRCTGEPIIWPCLVVAERELLMAFPLSHQHHPTPVLHQHTLPPTIITKVTHIHVMGSSASRQLDLNFKAAEEARIWPTIELPTHYVRILQRR